MKAKENKSGTISLSVNDSECHSLLRYSLCLKNTKVSVSTSLEKSALSSLLAFVTQNTVKLNTSKACNLIFTEAAALVFIDSSLKLHYSHGLIVQEAQNLIRKVIETPKVSNHVGEQLTF